MVSPIIVTHSCDSVAPIGCIALKAGIWRSTDGKVAAQRSMRGSLSKVAASGGGEGNIASQVSGARVSGSCARMSCRMVVPVRGMPMMKTGATICSWAMPGKRLRSAT
jgi:hypothetical protein